MAIAPTGAAFAVATNNKTSSTTLTGTVAESAATGTVLVIGVSFDNTGTSTPTVAASHAGSSSITWSTAVTADSPNATSAAGVRAALIVGVVTAGTLLTTDTITLTFSATITAKRGAGRKFTGVDVTTPVRAACTATTNGTGTSVAMATADTPLTGEMVVAIVGAEGQNRPGRDSDTTNGSWVNIGENNTAGGAADSNVAYQLSYKILTGDGSQTFDSTISSSTDWAAAIAVLQPTPPPPATRADNAPRRNASQAVIRAAYH